MPTKPSRQGNTDWPLTQEGLANLNDTVDDIYRKLIALGARIDDGDAVSAALAVRITALEASSVTAAGVATIMLAAGKSATVATSETQASGTAYGDLATAGPAVTVVMTGTIAIIWLSATASGAFVGNSSRIAVAVSGASTVAAADANAAAISSHAASHNLNLSRVLVLTGLTPGSNTFTVKYSNDGGGTWTFFNRSIAVYAP